MILGRVSHLDCLAFIILLIPQLLFQLNIFELISVSRSIPSIFLSLPCRFILERYFTRRCKRSLFVQQASPFEDAIVRCVRHAFAHFPPKLTRVFLSKHIALPFLRFRMLRHGFWNMASLWQEIKILKGNVSGLWIIPNKQQKPDLVIYYCHGGGFSAGSSYFYLEFFLAWVSLLKDVGYHNPAIFALEYSLVPDAVYPTQLEQTIAGYEYICSIIDPSYLCVGGDSAGGNLILSLLLYISNKRGYEKHRPAYAILISPWSTLVSTKYRNTTSDYLNVNSLHKYGRKYASLEANLQDPLVSPGVCEDPIWWAKASPVAGFCITFGSEEVLGPEIRNLIKLVRRCGCHVGVREEHGSIHAWPIATLYLSTESERLKGLRYITRMISQSIPVLSSPPIDGGFPQK